MASGRHYEKIDPAALLVAVVAVTIQTLGTKAPWSPITTVTTVAIGAIVFCFTWPHAPQEIHEPDYWIITAQSLVFGLISGVALGWPGQAFFVSGECKWAPDSLSCGETILKNGHDVTGTWAGLLGGAVLAVAFWVLFWWGTKRRIRALQRDEPAPEPAPDGAV